MGIDGSGRRHSGFAGNYRQAVTLKIWSGLLFATDGRKLKLRRHSD
jgi:hypothetical protein